MPYTLTILMLAVFTAGPQTVTVRGKVIDLTAALKARDFKVDPEPIAGQVALVSEDGQIIPLLSDDASRALFRDKRLQNRETVIVGRKHDGLPYLQVASFKVREEGKLQTPEYYCDVCAISVRYDQDCPCCQGPLVLRMRPNSD